MGLRMVARALWRSEARRVVPWSETLHEPYAQATVLNPFYNLEYKIIKKTRQTKTWIEVNISCTNLTPNRYNSFAPAIAYLSNDVTISGNFMTSQMNTIAMQRTSLRALVNGFEVYESALEYYPISSSTRVEPCVFHSFIWM